MKGPWVQGGQSGILESKWRVAENNKQGIAIPSVANLSPGMTKQYRDRARSCE
jgi:hypothetical protein